MAKKRLNFKEFRDYIASNRQIQDRILKIAEPAIENSKQELINEFVSHPVTSEIAAGSGASNSSNTLNGYGNLFSFIGFSSGDNPVANWVNFIKKAIYLNSKVDVSTSGDDIIFRLKVGSILEQDLLSEAPMPWEGGRSWIRGIERGISGFSYYISKASKGRSGGGIQSKNRKSTGGSFKNVPYWSRMWDNFTKNLNK